MNVKYRCDCHTPKTAGLPGEAASPFRPLFDLAVKAANHIYKVMLPTLITLEDAGFLESTYDEDILEPEWDVFI